MWGRSSTNTPTTPTSPPASTANAPPFLSQHHRRSSSSSSLASTSTATNNKLRKSRSSTSTPLPDPPPVETADDDVWNEGSDDDLPQGAVSPSADGSTSPSNASAFGLPIPSLSRATSWGFNPFAMLSGAVAGAAAPGSGTGTPTAAGGAQEGGATIGAEAVAKALKGGSVPVGAVEVPKKGKDRDVVLPEEQAEMVKGASKGVELEGEKVQEEIEEEAVDPRSASPTYQLNLHKEAIKPDVNELVADPVSLLARLPSLEAPRQPSPPPSPLPDSNSHRGSISGPDPDAEDSDEDTGYAPLNSLSISSALPQVVEFNAPDVTKESEEDGRKRRRKKCFVDCLSADNVDLPELRKLSWAGIPSDLRPMAWQLLLGYLPAPSTRRLSTLAQKRQEYRTAVSLAFSRGEAGLDGPIWHQIVIDVPRTRPGVPLWMCKTTQRSLERILYVWAIRHPASGYVQGINDLVTPFFEVFLGNYIESDPAKYDVSALPSDVLEALEADSFWCLSKLLDGIHNNYISGQPGIVNMVKRMQQLCMRVDAPLAYHLESENVEFMQFAFRWVNCLLMRELSVTNIIRMWDTYLAEGADAFSEFHLYVCLAFLVKWSDQLRGMDFQSIIMFLQSLPTQDWTDKNTELLLSEAFMWSRTFEAR
ncbi:GTPase activating protein [Pseudohyphozyma bogoriensis]|nr:GTPase activating protein [Pseudohyphozyma bogoriensis]